MYVLPSMRAIGIDTASSMILDTEARSPNGHSSGVSPFLECAVIHDGSKAALHGRHVEILAATAVAPGHRESRRHRCSRRARRTPITTATTTSMPATAARPTSHRRRYRAPSSATGRRWPPPEAPSTAAGAGGTGALTAAVAPTASSAGSGSVGATGGTVTAVCDAAFSCRVLEQAGLEHTEADAEATVVEVHSSPIGQVS